MTAVPPQSDGLLVRGGAGGISAALDDLDAAAVALHRSAAAVGEAQEVLGGARGVLDAAAGVLQDPVGAAALGLELLAVLQLLGRARGRAHELGVMVTSAVAGYRTADAAQQAAWAAVLAGAPVVLWWEGALLRWSADQLLPAADRLARGLEAAPPAAAGAPASASAPPAPPAQPAPPAPPGPAGAALVQELQPPALREHLAAHPGVAAGVAAGAQAPRPAGDPSLATGLGQRAVEPLVALAGAVLAGPGAVTAARTGVPAAASHLAARARALGVVGGTGTTVRAVPVPAAQAASGPPRDTAGLLRRVQETGDGQGGVPGRVRVERMVTTGGRPVAVLYVPGTQTWRTSSSTTALDGASDLEALARESTAVADASVQALRAAGVGPRDDLLLVGYSLGGLASAQMAADPAFRAQFHPVALVTAGSPIGGFDLPADVEVVALEHAEDWVPVLDGAPNPDRPSLTTVTAPTPAGSGAHDLGGYLATARAVDASADPSLVHARARVAELLDAPASRVSDYAAVRAPR